MIKILVAEDERDIRDLIAYVLRYAGYEVEVAANGAEAVTKAPEVKPDLILLDVRMPRLTGYEACRKLKAMPDVKDIPVVFLSAKGQDNEIDAGMEVGATRYILKPFAPDDLIKQVQQILAEEQTA